MAVFANIVGFDEFPPFRKLLNGNNFTHLTWIALKLPVRELAD